MATGTATCAALRRVNAMFYAISIELEHQYSSISQMQHILLSGVKRINSNPIETTHGCTHDDTCKKL